MEESLKLSPVAFWDVAFNEIDVDADSQFVMNKVFNYGLWEDMLAVMRYYGLDRVRREIVQAAYLKKTAVSFLCVILNLREEDFIVLNQRQKRQSIWTD